MAARTKGIALVGLFCLIFCAQNTSANHGSNCITRNEKTVSDAIQCIKSDYDKVQRPNGTDGQSLRIVVDLVVITIGRLDDIEMDYSLEFYIRQRWKDPLLRYSNKTLPENSTYAVLDHQLIDQLWKPDTYVENMKSLQIKSSSGLFINQGLRLFPDGTVLISSRVSATLSCSMEFQRFPMDTQNCPLTLSSYFFTESDLYYEWGEVYLYEKVKNNNQFDILGVVNTRSSLTFSSGIYSSLNAVFKFRRRVKKFMLGFYIPSILTVMLSWVSFYISPYSAPARCALGIITVLAVGGFLTGQRRSFPVVPYVMAADLYIMVCYVFTVLALVEYAAVHYLFVYDMQLQQFNTKKPSQTGHKDNAAGMGIDEGEYDPSGEQEKESPINMTTRPEVMEIAQPFSNHVDDSTAAEERNNSRKKIGVFKYIRAILISPCILYNVVKRDALIIDKFSRAAFPIAFCLFNAVYWVFYMTGHSDGI